MPLFSKGWWKLSRNPFSNPKEGQIFCRCYPLVDPLVTTCWLKASLYGVKHTPQATLMGQMFNILLPQRSKQWALILLQCPDTLTLTPGNSFPLPFHCHGWSRSQPAVQGLTAALVYPGLPAEADDRAIASSLHAKLIYAQATWIMRRKALGNHHKGYLMVHKWCPALKNLCSRSGSKINILVLWSCHRFTTHLQLNVEELNIMQEQGKRKILLSVMLGGCCVKSLALILTFKWHFC